MPILYYLQPNPITPDPNDQSARVLPKDIVDLEFIIAEMVKRGSVAGEADIRAVLTLLFNIIGDELARGNFVNLPIVNIRIGISGIFDSTTDNYDPTRHIIRPTVSPGALLFQKLQNVTVEKLKSSRPSPTLSEFTNVNTNTVDSILTPGGIGQIVGEELKFNPENPQEGVFFIKEDGEETKAAVFQTRTTGKLVFIIPASLTAGRYTIEVRRAYTKDNELRKGALHVPVTVA
jgi:hypothetical protein